LADETRSSKIVLQYSLDENRREKLPVVRLKIKTPYREYPLQWLEALIDTGYDGGLLIPPDHYRNAGLAATELPVEDWDIAESITGGTTLLQAAIAEINIQGLEKSIELRIETFQGNTAILLGLNGIKTLFLCLDGPNQTILFNR
jgi:predicted aspartyl protease